MTNLRNSLGQTGKQIFDSTLELVGIPSQTRTQGERIIAQHIFDTLTQWPYFQENPQYLIKCPIGDSDRFNVMAFVRGQKEACDRTLLYLGHMDTVDTGEYKNLESLACSPLELEQSFRKIKLPNAVETDLESGEWLFGRGTADMKAGVAALIHLLKEVSQSPQTFKGNILLAIVGDEEADSQGMISLARPLNKFAANEKLDLLGAINTDVVSQIDANAPLKRHIYLGAMGKIVPGVFVVGKGSHVGESLQGFDANQLLSRLTWLIDANMDLADTYQEKVTQPPVSLKQADLKEDYNGQVPYEGYAYYNFLNYKRGANRVLEQIKDLTQKAFEDCLAKLESQTAIFQEKTGSPVLPLNLEPRVITFSQLCREVKETSGQKTLTRTLDEIRESQGKNPELRTLTLAMVRAVWKLSGLAGPAAVVFIMPPYYPANDPDFDHPKFTWFNHQIKKALSPFVDKSSFDISLDKFFPYLSDASFCAFTEGDGNQAALENNMPCWNRGWGIDINQVLNLNLPVVDMGVHGKDFHKRFERVHVPYSMDTLPAMIRHVTKDLLTAVP